MKFSHYHRVRHWLKVFLGILCLFSLPACLTGVIPGDKRIVKIISNECDTDKPPFLGSGLLFEKDGRSYVLTSDHVVLHSQEGYCHSVSQDAFGEQKAQFLAADWGNGLALLSVPDLEPFEALPRMFELQGVESEPMDLVQVFGFPADSEKLLQDQRGKVIDPSKKRKLFALLPYVIELEGAHGEFGMSGGPVFHSNGQFLGVLSHQVLVPNDVGDDTSKELTPENLSPENHLLVIPARAAFDWLSDYFLNPNAFRVNFRQIAEAQRLKLLQFYSGHLFFLAWCKENQGCEVQVERQSKAVSGTKAYQDPLGHLAEIENYLRVHQEVNHLSFGKFRKGPPFRQPTYQKVDSMIDFFRKLDDSELTPMGVASTNNFGDKEKGVATAAERARDYYDQLYRLYSNQPPKELAELIYLLVKLESLFSTPWYFSKRDIDNILLDKAYGWNEIESKAPNLANEIRTMLSQIANRVDEIHF